MTRFNICLGTETFFRSLVNFHFHTPDPQPANQKTTQGKKKKKKNTTNRSYIIVVDSGYSLYFILC